MFQIIVVHHFLFKKISRAYIAHRLCFIVAAITDAMHKLIRKSFNLRFGFAFFLSQTIILHCYR